MKTYLLALICILGSFPSFAFTNINSGNVSGIWTLSASPYYVNGDIEVPSGTSLTVEAGVQVFFQGHYYFTITGSFKSLGTAAQPVVYKSNDTTGWYDDLVPAGGWKGFRVLSNSSLTNDTVQFLYSSFQDTKFGSSSTTLIYPANAISSGMRNLLVSHCEFFHNQSVSPSGDGTIFQAATQANQLIQIDHCSFHDNNGAMSIMNIQNYLGGTCNFTNNKIYNNTSGSYGILFGYSTNMQIEKNEFYDNLCTGFGTPISLQYGVNNIVQNKIHHNQMDRDGAISCSSGKDIIDRNLIVNNRTILGACAITDGGGAIHLINGDVTTSVLSDSNTFIVRNNIIANNYCAYQGGGIWMLLCKAKIMNNTIINNRANETGGAIYIAGSSCEIDMKNNIFFGNESNNVIWPSNHSIMINQCPNVSLDYNWMPLPVYQSAIFFNPLSLSGDTTHNMIGTNPQLSNPTSTNNYTDNAVIKDFSLLSSSSCINMGDTVGAFPSAIDYALLARIVGSSIDIGAYEFGNQHANAIHDIESTRSNIHLFPNPCHEKLLIQSVENRIKEINVIDMLGHSIIQQSCNAKMTELNVSLLTAGVYQLNVYFVDGTTNSSSFIRK